MLSNNGHKTDVPNKEKKSTYILTTSLKNKRHSPYQKCPMLTLPLNT